MTVEKLPEIKTHFDWLANLRVAFLSFDGCPLAPRARSNLRAAIGTLGSEYAVGYEEIDLQSDATTDDFKRWGSPTILINGVDVMGSSQGDACGCRIYASAGGVPTTVEILNAIRKLSSHEG